MTETDVKKGRLSKLLLLYNYIVAFLAIADLAGIVYLAGVITGLYMSGNMANISVIVMSSMLVWFVVGFFIINVFLVFLIVFRLIRGG